MCFPVFAGLMRLSFPEPPTFTPCRTVVGSGTPTSFSAFLSPRLFLDVFPFCETANFSLSKNPVCMRRPPGTLTLFSSLLLPPLQPHRPLSEGGFLTATRPLLISVLVFPPTSGDRHTGYSLMRQCFFPLQLELFSPTTESGIVVYWTTPAGPPTGIFYLILSAACFSPDLFPFSTQGGNQGSFPFRLVLSRNRFCLTPAGSPSDKRLVSRRLQHWTPSYCFLLIPPCQTSLGRCTVLNTVVTASLASFFTAPPPFVYEMCLSSSTDNSFFLIYRPKLPDSTFFTRVLPYPEPTHSSKRSKRRPPLIVQSYSLRSFAVWLYRFICSRTIRSLQEAGHGRTRFWISEFFF